MKYAKLIEGLGSLRPGWLLTLMLPLLLLGIRLTRNEPGGALLIEAETGKIQPPFRVLEDENAFGGMFVRPEQTSALDQGALEFPITVRDEGTYYIWARVLWPNSCANSITVSLDRDGKTTFRSYLGHDALFGRWHWVRTKAPVPLMAGESILRLTVSEFWVNLDRLILVEDELYQPELGGSIETEPPFADLDSGWIPETGTSLERRDGLLLSGSANTMILDRDHIFAGGMSISARLQAGDEPPEIVRLLFDVGEEGRLRSVELGGGRCRLISQADAEVHVLGEAQCPANWASGVSHEVLLERGYGRILVWLDGDLALAARAPREDPGHVGVGASAGDLHVLDITCQVLELTELKSNFDVDMAPLGEAAGWTPVNGLWERTEWREYPAALQAWGKGSLVTLAGKESWADYTLGAAVSVSFHSEAGLILRAKGEDRLEVLVEPCRFDEPGTLRLMERRDGVSREMTRRDVEVNPEEWFLLEAEARGPRIRVWLNDDLKLESQTQLSMGKAGLIAVSDSIVKRPSPFRPIHFFDSGATRGIQVPLKVTRAAREIGIYFNEREGSRHVFRVVYGDTGKERLEIVRAMAHGVELVTGGKLNLSAFVDGRRVATPPPQLTLSFLLDVGPDYAQANLVNRVNRVTLPRVEIETDPSAGVGIYDPSPQPAGSFDDVIVSGLPFEIAREDESDPSPFYSPRQPIPLGSADMAEGLAARAQKEPSDYFARYGFDTNFHAGRDLAGWRFRSGTWTLAPKSSTSMINTECLVVVVDDGDAVAEIRKPLNVLRIEGGVDISLPKARDATVGFGIVGANGEVLEVSLQSDPSSRRGGNARVEYNDSLLVEKRFRAKSQVRNSLDPLQVSWVRVGLGMGADGLQASVDGQPIFLDESLKPTGPFKVIVFVEGPSGSLAHFDDVIIHGARMAPGGI
jgi:hypothetical protein